MNVSVAKPVHIDPMQVFDSSRTGTEIEEYWRLPGRQRFPDPPSLQSERVPHPQPQKMEFPAPDRQKPMPEQK